MRVTNLSEDVSEEDLYELFGAFGHVQRVFIAKDRETGERPSSCALRGGGAGLLGTGWALYGFWEPGRLLGAGPGTGRLFRAGRFEQEGFAQTWAGGLRGTQLGRWKLAQGAWHRGLHFAAWGLLKGCGGQREGGA